MLTADNILYICESGQKKFTSSSSSRVYFDKAPWYIALQSASGSNGDLPVLYTSGVVLITLRLNPITSSPQQGCRRTTFTEVKSASTAVHDDINLK